jgi:integrase
VSRVKMLAENNLQTRVLSFAEQHRYLAKATPVLRDVATLILETVMRPEEVYTLRPENVDLVKSHLQVPHGKTAAARRRLRLTAPAREILHARMSAAEVKEARGTKKQVPPSPFMFPCDSDQSRPIPKVNNAHDRAVRYSKFAPFRLYDLRHTWVTRAWVTRAAMAGIDLVTLASMLGNSRIQMVLRYAHPTQEHQSSAMDQLERYNAMQQIAEFERQEAMTQ